MELIATARFKKAMDRAQAATAYTKRITKLVSDLANAGLQVDHPLLQAREKTEYAVLLVLTSNRGYCGGYNSNVVRMTVSRLESLRREMPYVELDVSGKRGISACKFRGMTVAESYTHFEDKPTYEEVEVLANRYLEAYETGRLDRLDVAYTKFVSAGRQVATVETLLPLGSLEGAEDSSRGADPAGETIYEFLPSAESILEEVVPTSFKVKLFKCFLDAAVCEQISRMVAMKSATENADGLIRRLSMAYNRARQSRITNEIMEVLGGVEALAK